MRAKALEVDFVFDDPAPRHRAAASVRTPSGLQRIGAACSGALLVALIITPFDVVKTRMQSAVRDDLPSSAARATRSHWGRWVTGTEPVEMTAGGAIRPVHGTVHGLRTIAQFEGWRNLWRGLTPTLLMQVPATVIYYLGYEWIRDRLRNHTSMSHGSSALVAGASARVIAAVSVSPIELIRTRMQAGIANYTLSSIYREVTGIVGVCGFTSLWRGLAPTLWRDVPFSAIYWYSFESIRNAIESRRWHLNEFAISFTAGAISGTIAAVVTTPFDVAKTLQQVTRHDEPGYDRGPRRSYRMLDIMRSIVRSNGLTGLFRGISPRIAKIAPSCAIMISVYEYGKSI